MPDGALQRNTLLPSPAFRNAGASLLYKSLSPEDLSRLEGLLTAAASEHRREGC